MGQQGWQYDSDGTIYIYVYLFTYTYAIWQLRFESGIWFLGSFVLATYSIGSLLASHVATKYGFRSKRFTQQKPEPVTNSGKKSIQTNLTLLDDLYKHTNVPRKKKFVTKRPQGVEARHCWPSPATTCKRHNFVQSTMNHQNLQLAGFCSGSFRSLISCFFSKLKTVFPIHFITQLWVATSSSDMMDYIYKHIYTQYINSHVLQYVSNLFWGIKHLSPKLRYLLQARLIQVAKLGPCRDSRFPLDPSSLS